MSTGKTEIFRKYMVQMEHCLYGIIPVHRQRTKHKPKRNSSDFNLTWPFLRVAPQGGLSHSGPLAMTF